MMDDNPYSSPDDATLPAAKGLADSRYCVVLVAVILGGLTLLYGFGVAMNLTFTVPGTAKSVLEVYPVWLLGTAFYGAGLGVITWRLIQYQAALKEMTADEDAGNKHFIAVHAKFWRTMMYVLLAFVANAIVQMTFSMGGLLNR
jgi:hypothetical protein